MSVDRLLGTVIAGRYRIDRAIGEGGMGAVFEATQLSLSRKVAIKVVKPAPGEEAERLKRFDLETQAIARMQHPHIVSVVDAGKSEDGTLFLAMELLQGETVRQALRAGPFTPERALAVVEGVASALVAAHKAGVIHRDLKAENVILWNHDGVDTFAKVLDFGVAKLTSHPEASGLTGSGFVAGTPGFIAPEQILGKGDDARSDLYSVGVMLFEMLSGQAPYVANNAMELMLKHLNEPVPRLNQRMARAVPMELDALVTALLQKDPELRPANAQALLDQVRELRGSGEFRKPSGKLAVAPATAAIGSKRVAIDSLYPRVSAHEPPDRTLTEDITVGGEETVSDGNRRRDAVKNPTPYTANHPTPQGAHSQQRRRRVLAIAASTLLACVLITLVVLRQAPQRYADNDEAERHLRRAVDAYWELDLKKVDAEARLAQQADPDAAMSYVLQASAILTEFGSLARADRLMVEAEKRALRHKAPSLWSRVKRAHPIETFIPILAIYADDEARAAFDAHLVHYGCNDPLEWQLFAVKHQSGHWSHQETTTLFSRARDLSPGGLARPATALGLSRAARFSGAFAAAKPVLDDAMRHVTSDVLTDEAVELALNTGDTASAVRLLQQLTINDRNNTRAAIRLAGLNARAGQHQAFDEVLSDLRRLPHDDMRRTDGMVHVAMHLAALGRLEEGLDLFDEAIRTSTDPARSVEVATLAATFAALHRNPTKMRAWINRATKESFRVDVAAARSRNDMFLRAVSALVVDDESAEANVDDLEILRQSERDIPIVLQQTEVARAIAKQQYDVANDIATHMAPCWREANLGRIAIAKARALQQGFNDAITLLAQATSDAQVARCTNGVGLAAWAQTVLIGNAMAEYAEAAVAQKDRAAATTALKRWHALWPRADLELFSTTQAVNADAWLKQPPPPAP